MMRIHQAVSEGNYPNTNTLGRELEVSSKSIQRDIEFMRDRLNLPLEYHPQKFGYYYTEEVRAFPSLTITEGELFALIVAEKALQQYRGTTFEKPLLSAIRKMQASLPETISFSLGEWEDTISFRTSAQPVANLAMFDLLAKAAANHHQLTLQYRKPGAAAIEERVVDPYHLANIDGEWFLFAYDHLRKDIRTFVPSRVQSAEPTGEAFKRPAGFSVEKILKGSFGVRSGEGNFGVVIQFTPEVADYIREKRWHPSQKLTELPEGGVELSLQLTSLSEIQRWILAWGGAAKVLAPAELIASIKSAAESISSAHNR
jgi:proteasome accessory factor B